ncbi:MAG: hypothetical protein HKN92_11765 [Chitinophagales bacterium]|nr:hypothetical protein [Chitinophagales bacterium]
MKEMIEAFFSYSSKERRGLLVLVVIVVIINALNFTLPLWYKRGDRFKIEIQNFYETEVFAEDSSAEQQKSVRSKDSLFSFDPNTLSEHGWILLGLKPKTVKTILNYRAKGGRFFNAEDLQKIYGLSAPDYLRFQPYINIKEEKKIYKKYVKKTKDEVKVGLNSGMEEDWKKLKGIGPVLSARIVKFRNALGGFHSVEQLKEVYGLPDSIYQSITSFIVTDSIEIPIFELASATVKELSSHPYVSYAEAKAILNYRDNIRTIDSLQQLVIENIINEEKLIKLKPYISP